MCFLHGIAISNLLKVLKEILGQIFFKTLLLFQERQIITPLMPLTWQEMPPRRYLCKTHLDRR